MNTKIVWILALIVICLLSFWAGKSCERLEKDLDELGTPTFEKKVIPFHKHDTWLYLKSKTWGITGNHRISVLSTSDELDFKPNEKTDFIFEDFQKIIFRTTPDSLIIYLPNKVNVPVGFQSPVHVHIVELSTKEYVDINKKEERGLQAFQ